MSEPKSRWGSLLSGAVAGLESRLDTILADDDQASARSRAEDAAKKSKLEREKALKAEQGKFVTLYIQFQGLIDIQTIREHPQNPERTINSRPD